MNESPEVKKTYSLQPGKLFSDFSKDYAVIIAIFALGLLFTISSKYFFTGENLKNILLQASTIAVVAVGPGYGNTNR